MKKKLKTEPREMGNGEEVVGRVKLEMGSVSLASLDCLPNELLVQILSYLQTKEAASTSVLSKRWRTLFAFRHNFDFDDSIFWHPEVGKRDRDEIRESFKSFVDRTLALQGDVPINKFSLKFIEGKHDEVHVDRWINYALEHGVSELHLRLTDFNRDLLPSNLFTSRTIVKLTLGTELNLESIPSDTFLPLLKILFLDTVWLEYGEFSDVLLVGCPALEDLTIKHKYFYGMPEVISISSKIIKRLTIIYKCPDEVDWFSIVSLDTPNLVQLIYSDYARRKYQQCNLDSLVNATLDLHFLECNDSGEQLDPNVTDLIYGIRNVKILELTYSAAEVILKCCKGGLPMFKNLHELVFSGNEEGVWKVLLPLMLDRSPNLKSLFLSGLYRCTYEHQFDEIFIPPSNKLNMLRINYYQGNENELKHISHFLLKMECLQVVEVYYEPTMADAKKVQLSEDLLKLPMASSKLKMQVKCSSSLFKNN